MGAGDGIPAGEHMIRQAVDAEDVRAAIITCARHDDFCLDVRKNQDDWPLEVWMTEANLDDDVYLGTYNFDPILGTMWIHKQPQSTPIVGSFMKNGWELIPPL